MDRCGRVTYVQSGKKEDAVQPHQGDIEDIVPTVMLDAIVAVSMADIRCVLYLTKMVSLTSIE